MSEITSNPTASENEIKIEMKFWEAVEITQETYNNYQENADDDLDNLNIEKFQNSQNQKGNFNLYHKFHDKDSNFSGMTYIYDDENTNTVNVAIACRGSVLHWFNQNRFDEYLKKEKEENRYNDYYEIVNEFLSSIKFSEETKKDWLRNNRGMLWKPNTDSDNCATNYATNILNKIKGDEKYKNKEINIITLGHSKGGREAQKQMLALLSKYKDDNKVNVCCLTFNSAPIVFYEFYQIGKHKDYCQNLYLTDELKIFKDILKLFNYFKYGNNCAYPLKGKFVGIIIFLSLLLVGPALYTIYPTLESEMPLLAFPTTLGIIIIILFFVLSFTKSLFIIVTCVLVLTFLLDSLQPLICINLVITAILVMVLSHYTHGINIFKDEKSSYEKLKDKNIREIICAKDLDKLANLKFRYISKSTQKLINGVPKFPYASRIYPKH